MLTKVSDQMVMGEYPLFDLCKKYFTVKLLKMSYNYTIAIATIAILVI